MCWIQIYGIMKVKGYAEKVISSFNNRASQYRMICLFVDKNARYFFNFMFTRIPLILSKPISGVTNSIEYIENIGFITNMSNENFIYLYYRYYNNTNIIINFMRPS